MGPYLVFSSLTRLRSTVDFHTPQLNAATDVARPASSKTSLVLPAPCIVPNYLKLRSGQPIAWEALGIAWAARHDALGTVLTQRSQGELDPASLREAGVTHVLTDSTCPMKGERDDAFTIVGTQTYPTPDGTATVRLLAVRPA